MQRTEEKTENPNLFPIILHEGVHVVDSRLIAEALGVNHADWFQNVILKYQDEIEKNFSLLRFENGAVKKDGQRGTKYTKYLLLDENQATFLATLSRNTPQVIAFKAKLVASFAVLRQDFAKVWELYQELTQELQTQEEWQNNNVTAIEDAMRFLLDYCRRLEKTNAQLKDQFDLLQLQMKAQNEALKQQQKAQDERVQNLEKGISQLQTSQTTFGKRLEAFETYLERVRKRLGLEAMCFVYVFYSPALKMYKIGWADDTEIRQHTLQNANPSLEFYLAIPVLNRRVGKSLENTLHLHFEYCRHGKTEWFSLSASDLQYCNMLRFFHENKLEEMPNTQQTILGL